MKKLIILAITLTGLSTLLNAQNSFPTSNAIWNESVQGHYNYYGLLGDTIISDARYSKLYQFSDTILSKKNIHGYIGALRNEEQKVWFKPAQCEEMSPDILLYDFSAQIGDTVWHNRILYDYYYINCSDSEVYYSIINSIAIVNNRKIYSVNGPIFNNQWIEGIGSDMGVLRSITTSPLYISPDDYLLNCFKHNDVVEYLNNPSCNKCFCPTANIENSYLESVNIYPNPTSGELRVTSNGLQVTGMEILDINGRKQQVTSKKQNIEGEMVINISYLPTGIYFVKIITEQGDIVRKIVKQ